jgi:hypothetical protein
MTSLRIEPADDTPRIIFDKENNKFEISGKSMPEDVVDFYQAVLDWLNAYKSDPLERTEVNFKLIYFNTASSKLILDILLILEEIHEEGKSILIKWHSLENDEDMQEAGEEYSEMVDLEFEYITYED